MRKFAFAALLLSMAVPVALTAQTGDKILKPADTQKLMPASVWYAGQAAPSQLRNSGGVKFADGHFVMATLVDTSGYSTGVAAKYQAYFIVEEPLKIGGQTLPAGVYGFGFIAGNQFVVTDIGGHDVLTVSSTNDTSMKRPMPLQVIADPAGGYRLYAGRNYVTFSK
ncbi:MAG: hypothetical protein ACLQHF_03035 [Terracidiphilus sp.]